MISIYNQNHFDKKMVTQHTYLTIFSLYWASIKVKLPGHLGMLQALVSSRFVVHCPPYLAFSMIFLLLVVGGGCSLCLHDGHSDQLLHWLSLQGSENKIISKNRYHIFSWQLTEKRERN